MKGRIYGFSVVLRQSEMISFAIENISLVLLSCLFVNFFLWVVCFVQTWLKRFETRKYQLHIIWYSAKMKICINPWHGWTEAHQVKPCYLVCVSPLVLVGRFSPWFQSNFLNEILSTICNNGILTFNLFKPRVSCIRWYW